MINVGSGIEKSINDYAKFIMKCLQLKLKIKNQNNGLDGTPRKLLDCSLAKKYGWKAKVPLKDGIGFAINDFIEKNIQKDVK